MGQSIFCKPKLETSHVISLQGLWSLIFCGYASSNFQELIFFFYINSIGQLSKVFEDIGLKNLSLEV